MLPSSSCYLVLIIYLSLADCYAAHNSRNRYIRRWHEGLKKLHLLNRSDWPTILNEKKSTIKTKIKQTPSLHRLPPMDVAAVNDLTNPKMPTFNEFQAMHSDSNLQRKKTAEIQPTMPSFVTGKSELKDTEFQSDNQVNNPSANIASLVNASAQHVSIFNSTSLATDVAKEPISNTTTLANHNEQLIMPSTDRDSETELPISVVNANKKTERSTTLRVLRNVAAVECGAKLLEASQNAKNPGSVLVNNNDEYLNQPCSSDKWFILETCEPVQLGTIQIANYELFSSRCKTFRVSVSDRYPSKQWEVLGTFRAHDAKGLQSFNLPNQGIDRLIKYVKFEMLDHYGSEHFCPITMVRLFGLVSDDLDDADTEAEPTQANELMEKRANGTAMNLHSSDEIVEDKKIEKPLILKDEVMRMEADDKSSDPTPPISFKDDSDELLPTDAFHRIEESTQIPDAVIAKHPTVESASPGILVKATQFFLRVLHGAKEQTSSELADVNPQFVEAPLTLDTISKLPLRHTDIYTVLYLLASFGSFPDPLQLPNKSSHYLGLAHLATCLFSFSRQLQSLPSHASLPISISSPYTIWPVCSTAVKLLNLTQNFLILNTSSPPLSLIRLVAVYLNISSVFTPGGLVQPSLRQLSTNGLLPLPEFLRDPSKRLVTKTIEVKLEDKSQPPAIVSPSLQDFVVPAPLGGSRKETAYMRLSNRVRQIETNVSISMRYLEELSQSYTKQTERLSHSFNLTIAWLKATAKNAEDRDIQQQSRLNDLEKRLKQLLVVLEEIIRPTTKPPYIQPESGTSSGALTTFLWSSLFATRTESLINTAIHQQNRSPSSKAPTCPSNLSQLIRLPPTCSLSEHPSTKRSVFTYISIHLLHILFSAFWEHVRLQLTLFFETRSAAIILQMLLHIVLAALAHALIYVFFIRRLLPLQVVPDTVAQSKIKVKRKMSASSKKVELNAERVELIQGAHNCDSHSSPQNGVIPYFFPAASFGQVRHNFEKKRKRKGLSRAQI